MSKKPFQRIDETRIIRVPVRYETKDIIVDVSKKMGIGYIELCGMWLEQIDLNDKILMEKVRCLKARREIERLNATRNALVAKLKTKGIMEEIDEMDESDLRVFLNKIKKRMNKKKNALPTEER